MLRTDILSNSLFDEFKPPFEASEFQEEIITPQFQRAVYIAHIQAYNVARQYKDRCTSITTAGITHDLSLIHI